jgi:hypothetical protein
MLLSHLKQLSHTANTMFLNNLPTSNTGLKSLLFKLIILGHPLTFHLIPHNLHTQKMSLNDRPYFFQSMSHNTWPLLTRRRGQSSVSLQTPRSLSEWGPVNTHIRPYPEITTLHSGTLTLIWHINPDLHKLQLPFSWHLGTEKKTQQNYDFRVYDVV